MAVRSHLFVLSLLVLISPVAASADGAVQPKYPSGFDCSAVAAGLHRQACNRSHLDPPMGAIPETKRPKSGSIIPPPNRPKPAMEKPSTIPRLPGTINSN